MQAPRIFYVFILCVFITGALYYALCKLILNQLIEKRFVRLCDQSHVRDAYSLQRWNPICNSACRRSRATSNNDQIKPLHFVNVQVKDSLFKQVQDRENRSVPTLQLSFFVVLGLQCSGYQPTCQHHHNY